MNLFKLLTYDVVEHNCAQVTHVANEWPSFWTSLRRRYHRLFRRGMMQQLRYYFRHPFYAQGDPLKSLSFITVSNNNDRALAPLLNDLHPNSYSIIDIRTQNKYVPKALVLFYSILYVWPLVKAYIRADKELKSLIAEWFDEFFETTGYLVVIEKLLRHSQVKLLVMANDHVAFNRAFIRVANELGIKTMYIQHCSVSTDFPALEFTYSFLDGEESLIKYMARKNPTGAVYLSGNSRFDIIKRYRTLLINRHKIGIASNSLDSEDNVRALCTQLLSLGYKDITIRPHPDSPFDPTWYIERGIEYSDSNVENPFAFLSRMRFVIAGECGINLDAALMEVCAIHYNMTTGVVQDVYEFIKNGITTRVDSIEELDSILKQDVESHIAKVSQKMSWYNAAYGKRHEGHIGEMMADFIRYEQKGDIDGFDKKYGFVESTINGCAVKVYSE